MPVVATALRVTSTSVATLIASLFVGGYMNNETALEGIPLSDRAETESVPGGDETCSTPDCANPPAPECTWWVPESGRETDTLCSAYALRRLMSADAINRATDRAQRCASQTGATCVLSHEAGFQLPAALVWSHERGEMRMFMLPRVRWDREGEAADAAQSSAFVRRVALVRPPFDQVGAEPPMRVRYNRSVLVEHVDMRSHEHLVERLEDEDAYCLQMLRMTVPEACLEGL